MAFVILLYWLVWLGLAIYLIALATRFVRAVEQIADKFGRHPGP
jgi:hypothetical protein